MEARRWPMANDPRIPQDEYPTPGVPKSVWPQMIRAAADAAEARSKEEKNKKEKKQP
jgi:hypothetical protein